MTYRHRFDAAARPAWRLVCLLAGLAAAAGCHKAPPPGKRIDVRPKVQLVKPQQRTLRRTIGQPGFIYAYEQTSIYPKVAGFLQKWSVDIGDPITKDQVIAEVFVPELEAEHRQKKARAAQDEVQVRLAQKMVEVARENEAVAAAQVKEARANVGKYEASVERWESEVQRLASASGERAINPQILEESRKQLKADVAAREAARASASAAEAAAQARKVDVEKARVDVEAARARVEVGRADEQRLAAMLSYTHILAPYDGIVVDRNANTGDYVQQGTGDLSAARGSRDQSSNRGAPVYVVARTDRVRVYVDVPEGEAEYVRTGAPAKIGLPALAGEEIAAAVTRTSWSLLPRSRTLRAEIDLPNHQAQLRPGMYAYGRVEIERPNVWAVPLACVVEVGNRNVCYLYADGKAVQTPVQIGINDGKWVELARLERDGGWTLPSGAEAVIRGDLAELSDGRQVQVAEPPSR
jgi:RND family efflux transporter MFP subunit